MLNLALSSVSDLLENIEIAGEPLVERFGGLVFPINLPESIGQTDSGQPIMRDKIVPVACGVTYEQCMSGSKKYQPIVPNSAFKSILYFEQLGDATVNTGEQQFAPKFGLVVYDIPVRLVFWGNMAKMNINGTGASECSLVAPVALKIQQTLRPKKQFEIPDPAYQKASVEFVFQGQEQKDATKIFGRYSYGNELAKFMLFPWDFFSLKYLVRLRINRNCVEDFTFGTPNNCPLIPISES